MAGLTDRWYPLTPHREQVRLIQSPARFRMAPAGRRSGKTERAKRYVIRTGLREALRREYDTYPYFLAAPTRDQAKAIFWDDLKKLLPLELIDGEPLETSLCIKTKLGAEYHVVGMDKPQRIEGRPWCGGVLDEYGNMKPTAWPENVRPALSDRGGWCWFIGVPEGRNHYYDLYREAAGRPDWDTFHWVSADILPPEEIAAARQDLDELTFQQEYEASFINFQGRCYYGFEDANITPCPYDANSPLSVCFDFNVAPGVAVAVQEVGGKTLAIWEAWIQRGSNTERITNMVVDRFQNHRNTVTCYGDATGGAGGSAKLAGSDWDIIRKILTPVFGSRLAFDVPRANPDERVRVNAVNARICSSDGIRRLYVDPSCSHLIRDFEGVVAAEDGRIEKSKDGNLTHISDAIGYYIIRLFPLERRGVQQIKRKGR